MNKKKQKMSPEIKKLSDDVSKININIDYISVVKDALKKLDELFPVDLVYLTITSPTYADGDFIQPYMDSILLISKNKLLVSTGQDYDTFLDDYYEKHGKEYPDEFSDSVYYSLICHHDIYSLHFKDYRDHNLTNKNILYEYMEEYVSGIIYTFFVRLSKVIRFAVENQYITKDDYRVLCRLQKTGDDFDISIFYTE